MLAIWHNTARMGHSTLLVLLFLRLPNFEYLVKLLMLFDCLHILLQVFEFLQEVFDEIGAVMPPEPKAKVKDFKQMARYLCHLDQPSKHRYDTADVKSFGAIDYQALVMSGQDEDEMIDEMCEFIDANMIISFRQFCVYVRNERPEWRVLVYHQYAALLSRYIKSLAWEMEQERRNL